MGCLYQQIIQCKGQVCVSTDEHNAMFRTLIFVVEIFADVVNRNKYSKYENELFILSLNLVV